MQKDIIVTGHIGEAGAALLAAQDPVSVIRRFPGHFLAETIEPLVDFYTDDRVETQQEHTRTVIDEIIGKCVTGDDTFTLKVGKKGLLTTLWDVGEALQRGFEVQADLIPVTQPTIELCELFGADPYKADSTGCFLLCSKRGNELCRELAARDVPAAVIGHTDESNAKKIVFGNIVRFVDKPR